LFKVRRNAASWDIYPIIPYYGYNIIPDVYLQVPDHQKVKKLQKNTVFSLFGPLSHLFGMHRSPLDHQKVKNFQKPVVFSLLNLFFIFAGDSTQVPDHQKVKNLQKTVTFSLFEPLPHLFRG